MRQKTHGWTAQGIVLACQVWVCVGLLALCLTPTASAQTNGGVTGIVVDQSGTAVAGAQVRLAPANGAAQQTVTDSDGRFAFTGVAPGSFQLSITAEGFAAQSVSGTLQSGDAYAVPAIHMTIATLVTSVRVSPPTVEIAEEQMKEEEKQRILGVVPNFYVTYIPDAAPLSPRQKFELAWKSTVDPVTFGIVGAIAGVQQAENSFSGYGQGAQGYAERYGASYGDTAIGTFLGSAVFPSILKQDPRYFYKGTGGIRARFFYAVGASVFCKGDNGRWQPNYSNILGTFAAGGISNLYYPPQNRGAALTFESALIGIGATSGANLLEEFVIRKLTPGVKPQKEDPPGL